MKRVWATIAITAALGAALLATPGPATAAKNCGNYAGSPVFITGDFACRKAKAIVKEFIKVRKKRIQGFNCKGSRTKVNCSAPGKSIRWEKS